MGKRTEDGEAVPTIKKQLRDARRLIKGSHEGKIVIENIKPKLEGGVHKVIDEQIKETDKFKETIEGETTG
jgi:hypothetical protein